MSSLWAKWSRRNSCHSNAVQMDRNTRSPTRSRPQKRTLVRDGSHAMAGAVVAVVAVAGGVARRISSFSPSGRNASACISKTASVWSGNPIPSKNGSLVWGNCRSTDVWNWRGSTLKKQRQTGNPSGLSQSPDLCRLKLRSYVCGIQTRVRSTLLRSVSPKV